MGRLAPKTNKSCAAPTLIECPLICLTIEPSMLDLDAIDLYILLT
jgi:hypothetical protein